MQNDVPTVISETVTSLKKQFETMNSSAKHVH